MRDVRDGGTDTLLRQHLHHVDESAVDLTDDVRRRHTHVLEEQLGGVRLVLADLVELAAALEASMPVSTANRVMPLDFFSGLVRAATITRSAL